MEKSNTYYTPVKFKTWEFVPPEIYKLKGDDALHICMDARILWTLDALRLYLGVPITINNWHSGGKFSQRGFRTITHTAQLSQHMFGRAVDFDIKGMDAEEFRLHVQDGDFEIELKYITRIEKGVNWIHIDCADVKVPAGNVPIVFFSGQNY